MTDTCPPAQSAAGPWNDSGANHQHPQTHAFTVTTADEYDDLCSYAHLAPGPVLVIDRVGRRWLCRTDVHRDLYGSVEHTHFDERWISCENFLEHLAPARASFGSGDHFE